MAPNNDGWEDISDPATVHAYAAAMLPKAPPAARTAGASLAPAPETAELKSSRDQARHRLASIDQVNRQLGRVQDLYNRNLKGSGPIKSLREILPSPENAQFDSAANQLRKLMKPLMKVPGDPLSDKDLALDQAGLPSRFNFDSANEESFRSLQAFLDGARADTTKLAGLPTPPPSVKRASPREFTIDRNGNLVH